MDSYEFLKAQKDKLVAAKDAPDAALREKARELAVEMFQGFYDEQQEEWMYDDAADAIVKLISEQRRAATKAEREQAQELTALILHARVHSGYMNCGYDQMTTDQKKLFDEVWERSCEDEERRSEAAQTE